MPWPFVPPDPDAPAPLAKDYTSSSAWRTAVLAWAGVPSHSPVTSSIASAWNAQWSREKGGDDEGRAALLVRDCAGC